ncbi:FAD-dependent monooxygenase [Streptomyces coelicoflavus]|uniref:FAD-dependent monooxygenase n=1 Tax=Streptomyces coelicoflavus TaxID=285562 RepID=UPI003320CBC0
MNILIAGAGIGGLTAALSLHAAGCEDVCVVEAAPEIRPLGAGINLLPNAVRELAALGLYEELLRRSVPLERLGYFNHHGQTVWSERRGHGAGHRWPQLAVFRGSLQELLADRVAERLGPDAVRTDARLTGFTVADSGRVRVDLGHRSRGGTASTVETDVLVGADGIRSAVRGTLYPQEGSPRSQGVVVWRGVTRSRPFMGGRSMVVMGDGHWKVVVYPLADIPDASGDVPVNWAASYTGDLDVRPAEVRDRFLPRFADWRCEDLVVRDVLGGAEPAQEFPMMDRDPLPRWSFGPVTLLGDAAHAMAPMGSNATTQAVVDARALAHAVSLHADPVHALREYDRERRPAMNRLQLMNRAKGPEVVIDLACARAPEGFTGTGTGDADDVLPHRELAAIAHAYATAAGTDPDSSNFPSPYGSPEGPAHPVRAGAAR